MIEITYKDGKKITRHKSDWKKDTLIAIAKDNKFIQMVSMDGEVLFER